MLLKKPKIFQEFPDLLFGLSTKSEKRENDIYNFNMSKSIGDSEGTVIKNRSEFFSQVGLKLSNVIVQKQIHSDIINVVEKFTENLEGDALITSSKNLGLAVSTADCTNIYLYDKVEKVIAAVHSGWMGTEKRILEKSVKILFEKFNTKPENLIVYFGPSICRDNYEVGDEFKNKFDLKYMLPKGEKFLLDLKTANKDMLLNLGVLGANIEVSDICSFENNEFHSYRRDKSTSGRALGVIAIKA